MVSFNSTETFESTARPGVKFTVRRLNKIQRTKRDAGILEDRVKLSELMAEMRALTDPATTPEEKTRVMLSREYQVLDARMGVPMVSVIQPAYIRAGLLSIEGYEIDGKPATAESLIEHGEDDLLEEIYVHCLTLSGLDGEQEKNSSSPGTSPEAADSAVKPTTANAAAV
jgi:hypothetical protein